MSDYGRGSVLGTVTTLPATSAVGLMLAGNVHPAITAGFVVVMSLSLVVLVASVSRYLINRKAN